ncbi:Phosphatidylinositol 3,5-bisphosphate-binding protein [Mycoemilia scoparia]|uniref:Phosphatidylinositol 3,5-bisphosphate-binding protein n=1 Tax=Mycoemilia scoparia TaxID=417184 RepID=A0A9W8DPR1_9FUNG|nr:Phosphatidylinositol 3,5-bisphosphate-binding protein [Mycoemilia scoparia]
MTSAGRSGGEQPLSPTLSPAGNSMGGGLLFADFNQDYGCFAVGTENGFRIYNSDPFKEKKTREFEDGGGIGMVSMLYRTNYLALVGGGRNPQFPPNRVMLWDDAASKLMAELEFRSNVHRVLLKRHHIVVVLRNKCVICSLESRPKKLHAFDTFYNDKGVGAVSSDPDTNILVFPGRQRGHIQIVDLDSVVIMGPQSSSTSSSKAKHQQHQRDGGGSNGGSRNPSLSPSKSSSPHDGGKKHHHNYDKASSEEIVHLSNINIIPAHSTAISALAINSTGTRVASASEKGTLIRVFNTVNGTLLHEFRRGVDRADIYNIAFSPDSTRLCVASDKGTIHIFNLESSNSPRNSSSSNNGNGHYHHHPSGGSMVGDGNSGYSDIPSSASLSPHGNRKSSFAFMKDLLPKYFSSEWSFTHIRIPGEVRCICGFGQERNSIIVLCADGTCQKYMFDTYRGQAARQWQRRFI